MRTRGHTLEARLAALMCLAHVFSRYDSLHHTSHKWIVCGNAAYFQIHAQIGHTRIAVSGAYIIYLQ